MLGAPLGAQAAWTNGQAATVLLGAADFTTAGGGAASASQFTGPTDICTDTTSGKVFVVLFGENRILRFTSAAAATTHGVAEAVLGQPDMTSTAFNTGGQSAATLSAPFTCAIDVAGRLFVTDIHNHRVLRYDNASNKATGAAADGVLGQANFTSFDTSTTASTFGNNFLWGIALGANGSLYVSDAGNQRVLRFDNAASKANGGAADGVLGAADFTTPGAGGVSATTMSPGVFGLTLDAAGNLYVADGGNQRVMRFNNAASKANGAAADGVLGVANLTTTAGSSVSQSTFSGGIVGIDVLPDGALYVADAGFNRVLMFNSPASKTDGANADSVLGQPDFVTSAPALTASGLSTPIGLGFDSTNGNLMIPDNGNNRVVGHHSVTLIANALPTASAVVITGAAQVGVALSGSYTYADAENNTEGTSTFRWVHNSVNTGVTGGTAVATTQNYTAVGADVANFLYFCVTPVASAGNTSPGTEVCSSATVSVAAATVPAVTGVPTLSEWGMIILSALVALAGMRQVRRRQGVGI
jgi:hypothetical protein